MRNAVLSLFLAGSAYAAIAASPALADSIHQHHRHTAPNMAATGLLGAYPMGRDASGTSWQPDLARHGGLHAALDDWQLMGHLRLTGFYDWQSGPRGDTGSYLAGMLMGMARRDIGADTVSFRLMLSPDPFMGKAGYPLLLAGGETADGVTPLIDRQHPHDLIMELSASFAHRFDQQTSAFLYLGYPGEPAFGPSAFMHRPSAIDNPAAPLSHHWLDSTHITFGVVTMGVAHDSWKLEYSRFTGREPDQFRFNFDTPRLDSNALRLSWNPAPAWSLQLSWADLKSPEQLSDHHDETRLSASATYIAQIMRPDDLALTAAWGRRSGGHGGTLNALLAEAQWTPYPLWTVYSRAEWLENGEWDHGHTRRAGAISLGLIRDFQISDQMRLGLGGQYGFFLMEGALKQSYGDTPRGALLFVRLALE